MHTATALRFCVEGAGVMIADINDEAGQGLAQALTEGGAQAVYQHLDVSDASQWSRAVKKTCLLCCS